MLKAAQDSYSQYAHPSYGLTDAHMKAAIKAALNVLEYDIQSRIVDRHNRPAMTHDELLEFKKQNQRDGMARIALAAWINVRPDQLPKESQAHTCPITMEAWGRVASSIEAALVNLYSNMQNQLKEIRIELDKEKTINSNYQKSINRFAQKTNEIKQLLDSK